MNLDPPGTSELRGHTTGPQSRLVLGMRVDATSYRDATDRVARWAAERQSRYVCVSNVHVVMETYDDASFRGVVNAAALVTPDGMPLVWALRLLGIRSASRVYGPELTPHICKRAEQDGLTVAFIGGATDVLEQLLEKVRAQFPRLRVSYSWSPPFRDLTTGEEDEMLSDLRKSGAQIVFVGLGCPKQEKWMGRYSDRIAAPIIGVGAAFDFIAGRKAQAPPILQRVGLEWLFRLMTEPRRLWRRYVYHNPRFVALFIAQLWRSREAPMRSAL